VVIGVIVFIIITLINFVVITKGSGRIAEVAARFTLDAMPGKQMAIDADLSAGLIDEKIAKKRRKELEDESAFFGSMGDVGTGARPSITSDGISANHFHSFSTTNALEGATPDTRPQNVPILYCIKF
jgi:flagellar biosynthesis protein FlhA